MRRLGIAAIVLSVACAGWGQARNAEQEVRKAEQAWVEASQNMDRGTMERLIAEDFVGVTTTGAVLGKQDILPPPEGQQGAQSTTLRDLQVHVFGETAVGVGAMVFQGKDGSGGAVKFSNVWLNRNGKWQMISAHLGPRETDE
jgi:ketosteroid isomerase-like protein